MNKIVDCLTIQIVILEFYGILADINMMLESRLLTKLHSFVAFNHGNYGQANCCDSIHNNCDSQLLSLNAYYIV